MVAIVKRGVLRLLRILGQEVKPLMRHIDPGIPSIDVGRQIQLMCRIHKDGVVVGILMLVDPRAAQGDMGLVMLKGLDETLESHLKVHAAHERMVVVPVSTLLAREGLQRHTIDRLVTQSRPAQCIVDAERALLVGPQDESGSKLLIIVAHGQFHILVMSLDIEMGHAPPFQVRFIARQRIFEELKTSSCLDILAAQLEVQISVGQHFVIVVFCTDFFVFLWNKDITLDATAQGYLRRGLGRREQDSRQQQHQG